MTMSHERTKSIRWGFELLGEIRLDESINVSLRDPARGLRTRQPPCAPHLFT